MTVFGNGVLATVVSYDEAGTTWALSRPSSVTFAQRLLAF